MSKAIVLEDAAFIQRWVDDIPVLYLEPSVPVKTRKLAIFLSGLGRDMVSLAPFLKDIAAQGFVALSFEKYQHGARDHRESSEVAAKVFTNMRRYGWPILGQSTLDAMRVIDWAIANLDVADAIHMGGISMGGDITLAVAGHDRRLVRCAPIIATPDWLRPGMHVINDPTTWLDPGKADAYAQYFYDQFNPITQLSRYINIPPVRMVLGAEDTHIPSENAERFKTMLADLAPRAAARIEITYVKAPRADHRGVIARSEEWWPELRDWWLEGFSQDRNDK